MSGIGEALPDAFCCEIESGGGDGEVPTGLDVASVFSVVGNGCDEFTVFSLWSPDVFGVGE